MSGHISFHNISIFVRTLSGQLLNWSLMIKGWDALWQLPVWQVGTGLGARLAALGYLSAAGQTAQSSRHTSPLHTSDLTRPTWSSPTAQHPPPTVPPSPDTPLRSRLRCSGCSTNVVGSPWLSGDSSSYYFPNKRREKLSPSTEAIHFTDFMKNFISENTPGFSQL